MDHHATFDFHFLPTGIGSVPYLDVHGTCLRILETCPRIPFWPQFVQRSHLEDMIVQFTEGLPFSKSQRTAVLLTVHSKMRKQELVAFYDRFLAEDVEHFALSKKYISGLFEMLSLIDRDPEKYGPFIKGHTVGPVTLLQRSEINSGQEGIARTELTSMSESFFLREGIGDPRSVLSASAELSKVQGRHRSCFLTSPTFGRVWLPRHSDADPRRHHEGSELLLSKRWW